MKRLTILLEEGFGAHVLLKLGEGQDLATVAKQLEISEATFHRWRHQYGGMKAEDAKELRHLRDENQRLKRMVADRELQIEILKEISRGNF